LAAVLEVVEAIGEQGALVLECLRQALVVDVEQCLGARVSERNRPVRTRATATMSSQLSFVDARVVMCVARTPPSLASFAPIAEITWDRW